MATVCDFCGKVAVLMYKLSIADHDWDLCKEHRDEVMAWVYDQSKAFEEAS